MENINSSKVKNDVLKNEKLLKFYILSEEEKRAK